MSSQPLPVGEELRRAREDAGLDLADVAAHLRIRSNFLSALEEGRPDALPGITYAIGYVRTYAAFLGLQPDAAVRRFKEEAAGLNSKTQLVFPSPAPEGRVPGLILMLVAAVLAGGAYGGWYWVSERDGSLRDLVPAVPERLAQLIEGDAPSLPQVADGQRASGPYAGAKPAGVAVARNSPPAVEPAVPVPATGKAPTPSAAAPSAATPSAATPSAAAPTVGGSPTEPVATTTAVSPAPGRPVPGSAVSGSAVSGSTAAGSTAAGSTAAGPASTTPATAPHPAPHSVTQAVPVPAVPTPSAQAPVAPTPIAQTPAAQTPPASAGSGGSPAGTVDLTAAPASQAASVADGTPDVTAPPERRRRIPR